MSNFLLGRTAGRCEGSPRRAMRCNKLLNERFVPECYTPDCKVYAMGAGMVEGAEQFLQVESAVLAAAPKRYMRFEHMHASGDVVTVEVTLLDPDAGEDWAIPFVAVLTMRDGKIAIDRSYADYTNWPGLEAFANLG